MTEYNLAVTEAVVLEDDLDILNKLLNQMKTDITTLLSDVFSQKVNLNRVVEIEDYRGKLTRSFGSDETILVFFLKRDVGFEREGEGYFKSEPSVMICKISDNVKPGDKITVSEEDVYKVFTVRNRQNVYLMCELYLDTDNPL